VTKASPPSAGKNVEYVVCVHNNEELRGWQSRYEQATNECSAVKKSHVALQRDHDGLQQDNDTLQNMVERLQQELNEAKRTIEELHEKETASPLGSEKKHNDTKDDKHTHADDVLGHDMVYRARYNGADVLAKNFGRV